MADIKNKTDETTAKTTTNDEFVGGGLEQAMTLVKSVKDTEYYKTTREITKQALRPVSRDGDLFNSNVLSSEAKKYALMLKGNKGKDGETQLLSEIGDGLN